MPVVSNTQSLQAGVKKDLMDFWRQKYPVYREQQEKLMRILPQTNLRNASYPFKESLPFPTLWPYGTGRIYQTFKDKVVQMNIVP